MTDPMITAAQHLEASPKPSYVPHKANERYLDDEDDEHAGVCLNVVSNSMVGNYDVGQLLQALETLRTHLRKKYYAG